MRLCNVVVCTHYSERYHGLLWAKNVVKINALNVFCLQIQFNQIRKSFPNSLWNNSQVIYSCKHAVMHLPLGLLRRIETISSHLFDLFLLTQV